MPKFDPSKCQCNDCKKMRAEKAPLSLTSLKNCTGDTPRGHNSDFHGKYAWLANERERTTDPANLPRRQFLAKARQAMNNGAVQINSTLIWNLSANSKYPCLEPVLVNSFRGMADSQPIWVINPKITKPIGFLDVYGRCRKCAHCRTQNRLQWISRIFVEYEKAGGRTWFVTLTSAQAHRQYVDHMATQIAFNKKHEIFSRLDADEKFKFRADAWRREISLYMKRLRKGVGGKAKPKIRFFCVFEAHKTGHVHAHLLIFEVDKINVLSERLIRSRWRPRGICEGKLVKNGKQAVAYVSKYIAKDLGVRPQNSLRFGRPYGEGHANADREKKRLHPGKTGF